MELHLAGKREAIFVSRRMLDCWLQNLGSNPSIPAPEKMNHIRTSWRGARAQAGLDKQVNPYSIRHTMERWLKKEGVSAWEVSAQLGHMRSDLSITEIYAPYDPTYLDEAVSATNRMDTPR